MHESILTAVRRWLPRHVPWNKNRIPGRRTAAVLLPHPGSGCPGVLGVRVEKLYSPDEEAAHRRRERDLENRRSDDHVFSDETRDPPSCSWFYNESYGAIVVFLEKSRESVEIPHGRITLQAVTVPHMC